MIIARYIARITEGASVHFCCINNTCERCLANKAYEEEMRAKWLVFLGDAGITPEQLAIARAAAVEKMHGPRTDGLHLVKVDAKDAFTPPLRSSTAELDAAFARFVESHLRSIRLDRCGPYPRRLRVIARLRWRRKMRALEALDAQLIATMVALGRGR